MAMPWKKEQEPLPVPKTPEEILKEGVEAFFADDVKMAKDTRMDRLKLVYAGVCLGIDYQLAKFLQKEAQHHAHLKNDVAAGARAAKEMFSEAIDRCAQEKMEDPSEVARRHAPKAPAARPPQGKGVNVIAGPGGTPLPKDQDAGEIAKKLKNATEDADRSLEKKKAAG